MLIYIEMPCNFAIRKMGMEVNEFWGGKGSGEICGSLDDNYFVLTRFSRELLLKSGGGVNLNVIFGN